MAEDHPRERDKHPAIIVVVALAILASVTGLYVALRAYDVRERIAGTPATLGPPGPIETVSEIVDEPARSKVYGRTVTLEPTPVEEVVGDALFWIGEPGRRVPVLLVGERMARQPDPRVDVSPGDRVVVYGVVQRTRESSVLNGAELLDAAERAAVLESDVYVSARRVVVTRRVEEQRRAQADR